MSPQLVRRGLATAVSVVSLVSVVAALPNAGAAVPKTIHPGIEVNYGNISCAVGAILKQRKARFLAIPASCGGIDPGKPHNNCYGPQTPVGSPVSIEGASRPGQLVYSSYSQMQLEGVTAHNRCFYDDLALVRVNRHDLARVSPAIPGTSAPRRLLAKFPASGTALKIGSSGGTAGSTANGGWTLGATSMAMFKAPDVGLPITAGNDLVGMLLVLPQGPASGTPLDSPAQTFNMARALRLLRQTAGFHHVTLLRAG